MAEHIYSKGTRVWFPDKEQGWISAEVTSVTRGAADTFKLGFVDERGKVRRDRFHRFASGISHLIFCRKSPSAPLPKISKTEKRTYPH